ncbi:MAG: hypothetical protein HOJ99_04490 [Porticoccaceae bacterium]|jgi:acyl-CoA thioesterase FadM|nr:hypothetical protein [Porticoccaceae bacterium]MBT5577732.1 hypothetical protein [Porticoccaceae bacterium]MDG1820104.1 hypothetical protein [Porticoccaceae bacterium]
MYRASGISLDVSLDIGPDRSYIQDDPSISPTFVTSSQTPCANDSGPTLVHDNHQASDWDLSSEAWKNRGWADVSHQIDYKNELHAGTLVEVTGGIREIGRSSFTSFYSLRNKMTGVEAATMLAKVVFFDLQARKSMPITDRMREQMARLLVPKRAIG